MIDIKKIRAKLGLIQKKYIFLLTAIVILVLSVIAIFIGRQANKQPPNTTSVSASVESPFGTMLAFNINDALMGTPGMKGWSEFKKDSSAYQNLKNNLEKLIQTRTKLVKTTGFSVDREIVPYFTWNVVEPQRGQFDWELTDLYVQATIQAGVKISAVIQPFASWDQKNTSPLPNCNAMDFAYFDYKIGSPKDLTEYENFLTKTVERYKDNVAVWEIGNEYDGPCGGYENNPQGYFDLVKITSETIKKTDPKAIVTNGGASEMVGSGPGTDSTKNFWTKFFTLGGDRYVDYFNFHYNTERSQGSKLSSATLQEAVTFLNDLMDKSASGGGGRKPLYLTEFGIYSGTPSSQLPGQLGQGSAQTQTNAPIKSAGGRCGDGICDNFEKQNSNACPQDCGENSGQPSGQPSGQTANQNTQPSQGQTLRNVSENEQMNLYFKDTILAFANGVKVVFIDLIGPDGGLVGSSMAFNANNQPRLFLTTLKTIESKIGGSSKVEKIADGQYKFMVGNKDIYTLWSGTLPNEISGKVKVADIKGQEQFMDAMAVKLSADQPIFIEVQR